MLGWIGSILLAFCAVPELIRTVRDNYCHVGYGMLLTWFFGEVFILYHVSVTHHDIALVTNYALNIALISILLYYKITKKHILNSYKNNRNQVIFKEISRFDTESVMLRTDINVRLLIPHSELKKHYTKK